MNHYSKNMYRFSVVCVLALIQSLTFAEDVPRLLRVAVIDNSGSMAGERIASVRDELTKIGQQLPPSTAEPIILIKFGSVAASPLVFTDLASFEAAIAELNGDSGGP